MLDNGGSWSPTSATSLPNVPGDASPTYMLRCNSTPDSFVGVGAHTTRGSASTRSRTQNSDRGRRKDRNLLSHPPLRSPSEGANQKSTRPKRLIASGTPRQVAAINPLDRHPGIPATVAQLKREEKPLRARSRGGQPNTAVNNSSSAATLQPSGAQSTVTLIPHSTSIPLPILMPENSPRDQTSHMQPLTTGWVGTHNSVYTNGTRGGNDSPTAHLGFTSLTSNDGFTHERVGTPKKLNYHTHSAPSSPRSVGGRDDNSQPNTPVHSPRQLHSNHTNPYSQESPTIADLVHSWERARKNPLTASPPPAMKLKFPSSSTPHSPRVKAPGRSSLHSPRDHSSHHNHSSDSNKPPPFHNHTRPSSQYSHPTTTPKPLHSASPMRTRARSTTPVRGRPTRPVSQGRSNSTTSNSSTYLRKGGSSPHSGVRASRPSSTSRHAPSHSYSASSLSEHTHQPSSGTGIRQNTPSPKVPITSSRAGLKSPRPTTPRFHSHSASRTSSTGRGSKSQSTPSKTHTSGRPPTNSKVTSRPSSSGSSTAKPPQSDEPKRGDPNDVSKGDVFKSQYEIVQRLGAGDWSTVWLAWDLNSKMFVALKISRETRPKAEHEINLYHTLNDTVKSDWEHEPEGYHHSLVRMFDAFEAPVGNGHNSIMVFEVLGKDLLSLVTNPNGSLKYKGIPVEEVKCVARKSLEGLVYLHDNLKLFHCDLKPENILLTSTHPSQFYNISGALKNWLREHQICEAPDDHDVIEYLRGKSKLTEAFKIIDLGASRPVGDTVYSVDMIQTLEYRSPEIVLGYQQVGTAIDIWSLACVLWEMLTGVYLFNPRNDKPKNAMHMALFISRLGPPPKSVVSEGKYSQYFFDSDGSFKHNIMQFVGFDDLVNIHGLDATEAAGIVEFLKPMLAYDPSERVTAKAHLQHPWLQDLL